MSDRLALRVTDLTVAYGEHEALDRVSFDLSEGEFVSIVGPSGCGKSTTLAALMGEVNPSSGTVEVPGADRSPFAWMPQSDSLLAWRSTLDNACLGLEVLGSSRAQARKAVSELIEPFGLAGRENAWPAELSGGMRQRVALLRTVVLGRPILLLDEPFGALDALTRRQMQAWLEEVRGRFGWTILLITHDVREAVALSDRVLVYSDRPARLAAQFAIDLPRPRVDDHSLASSVARIESDIVAALMSFASQPT
jgi:ABC-type nitrate/sulfonate/bicarbonate transport system ATPase subunit